MKIKSNKGYVAQDALIAILIIILFSSLIATVSYNIYLSNTSVKRMSRAKEYIVDMFEYIEKTNYDDVTEEKLIEYFNNKYGQEIKINDEESNLPYKANINIIKFNETEGNEEKLDLVKEITMDITYKLGNKEQKIEMTRNKSKEK